MDLAHMMALQNRLKGCGDWERSDIQWALDLKRAILLPDELSEERLGAIVGNYNSGVVELRDGSLRMQFQGLDTPWMELHALDQSTFMVGGDADFRLSFRITSGQPTTVLVQFRDGTTKQFQRRE